MTSSRPDLNQLPTFSSIKIELIESEIEQILLENRNQLNQLLEAGGDYNWESLILPLDDMEDRLNKAWSPISHMNSVVNSDELRNAYNACLPKLSAYSTEIGQNQKLQLAIQRIADSADFHSLDTAQKKIIADILRDFKLSGVALTDDKK